MSADQPLTLLLAWLVLALAAGVKVWRLARLLRRQLQPPAADPERFRLSLEKLWAQQQRL